MSDKQTWKEQIMRYNSKKDIIKFMLIFPPACLIVLLVFLSYIFHWEWPDWLGFIAGYAAFGGMLIGSVVGCITSLTKCRKEAGKDAIIVEGTIIGHYTNSARRKFDRLYYPLYEYSIDGKKYELVSNIGAKKRGRTVGTKVKILYDPTTGNAFCVSDMRTQSRLYLILATVGALTVALITITCVRYYS